MFERLKNRMDGFLGKFSIKDKYLGLAILFLLCIPYPTYVAARTLMYRKERAEAQLSGNHFQASLAALLRNVTRLQVMSWSEKIPKNETNTKRAFVKQRISQILKKMNSELDNFIAAPLPPIGKGYSEVQPTPPRVLPLMRYWTELKSLADSKPHSEQTLLAYRRMSNAIREEMAKVGYSSSLFLPTTPINYHLGQLALLQLPQSQQLTLEMFQRAMRLKFNLGIRERVLEDIGETIDLLNKVMGQIEETITRGIYLARSTKETLISPEIILNAEDAVLQYKQSVIAYQKLIVTDFNMQELTDIVLDVVEAVKTMANFSTDMIGDVVERKFKKSRRTLNTFFITMGVFSLMLLLLIAFRILSNHLVFMIQEIEKHAKGDFTKSQLIGFKDPLGKVAQNFTKIAAISSSNLNLLSKANNQIERSYTHLYHAVELQEKNILEQLESIKEVGLLSEEITVNSERLNAEMEKLRINTDNLSLEAKAREGLDSMKSQMELLTENSLDITKKLGIVKDKVDATVGLVSFMGKVGDHAQMLSLNAAIEASSAEANQRSFYETVEKIQRFSSTSIKATKNIQSNIERMSDSASITLFEIKNYVDQKRSGTQGLHVVSHHFNIISQQIEKQWDEFTNITRLMNIQSGEAESIQESLIKLEESIRENVDTILTIKRILSRLYGATGAVEQVLSSFKFTQRKLGLK